MKTAIEKETEKLAGLKLRYLGRASNLLWLGFGDLIDVVRRGETEELAEFALHVQCAWRITKASTIYVGSHDFYVPSSKWEGDMEDFYWDIQGNNRFDERVRWLMRSIKSGLVVENIEADTFGGLTVYLSNDYTLEIFPNSSETGDYSESWRLFRSGDDSPHFVVSGQRIEKFD
ncbi:hypothetical protein QWY14_03090 [Planococcus sp. N028]|uniref:Uncharacterized protein n=1 Tax=Planococcus shixiaomingii TaxID=3058393 RepID=A0ABT8MZI8_9BACL|nr:hypothetical protein [Planococcus sp. N028]MDN7240755.1 hypothetical protein [Planococcus sp. N028]